MRILHNQNRGFAESLVNFNNNFTKRKLTVRNFDRTFDFNTYFFTAYPNNVSNAPTNFVNARTFVGKNKYGQRKILENFFPVPWTGNATEEIDEDKYPLVVRPYRHFGGRFFQVVHNQMELLYVPERNTKYVSTLFKRDKEYRHIFVGGRLVLTLFKKIQEGIGQEEPWNHDINGTRFVTVTKNINDKLLDTDFGEKATRFFEEYPLDLAAIDTCWKRRDNLWTVLEINVAPQITKTRNLDIISREILQCRNIQTL